MAQVIAFVPDLLFGSNVLGMLQAAGHEAVLVSDLQRVDPATTDVLVVDLTADAQERIARVAAVAESDGVKRLAFYLHTEVDVRALAEQAGFDLVVPRSRMAREGAGLVSRLAAG
jgi:hypothetical protein